MVGIQVPAPFSSGQWFAGADPALDAIERGEAVALPTIVVERGGAISLTHYERVREQVGGATWWQPWDHRTMRRTGDSLLAIGRLEDARAAYQLNASHYPCEWRSWDSYGEGSLAAADSGAARAAFQRALDLEPDNWNNARQREALGALSRVAPPSAPGDSIDCRVRP
jgi:tetratricopeptide (TPR) repeat protein